MQIGGKAEVIDNGPAIAKGQPVRIRGNRGIILLVEHADNGDPANETVYTEKNRYLNVQGRTAVDYSEIPTADKRGE